LAPKNISLIPVTDGFSHMFAVSEALKKNELLGMHADRVYEGSQNVECDFMGAKAYFPEGAFKLAVKFKVPVLAIYVMQSGYKKYTVHSVRLESDSNPGSTVNGKINYLLKQYVNSLEVIMDKYPLQWYNFHPFWTEDLNEK
jgi:predicted LPLAT superfamily acyltransferase